VQIINVGKQIAGTCMKYPSVFRQLHATRRPVQKPDIEIFFRLSNCRSGPSLLKAEAIGWVGEAPHFRDRYENEDRFNIPHFRGLALNNEFTSSLIVIPKRHNKLRTLLPPSENDISKTMSLPQVPEMMTLHSGLWAGRIMSAFVVTALVADGAIQLLAPAQIASMLQETGFAIDLTRVVGPITLACAILYAIPTTAVLGAVLVTGFLGGAICAHVRIGELGSPAQNISLLLGVMTWGGLYLRDARIRAILPLVR
jgi:hypothetical protein